MMTTSLVTVQNCNQIHQSVPPPEIRIEVADSLASSPFIDRFFNSAVIILTLLLLSGSIWIVSKVFPQTQPIHLEEIALAVFTLTLIAFSVLGLTAMCVICSTNDEMDTDGSHRRKDNEMMARSNSLDVERSCDTVCDTSIL